MYPFFAPEGEEAGEEVARRGLGGGGEHL